MSDDPDIAQARVFLDLLATHARGLARAISTAERTFQTHRLRELHAEMHTVRHCIARIHYRYPDIVPNRQARV
ncbi:hypothetical protein [Nocardia brasiliensis]|uniref:Transposase n=1 Tax=Nocardia brasiliensis (strain ATCC 700358 / HUJEG-1) TaxID=1133849 RepID=K0F1C7_NOCB7|nr:hypothetical protein [Nocardia brasiliensis]AFU01491.1 hypothetical protein O3I_017650 [Nocardia brasiliensis ATCC 700358]OCF85905.1 hypothetical protein AW168_34315 [Nocardia brasiliensis]